MTASSNKEKDDSKVFDVAKPGKTTPDSSSRPLIVGHRSMLKQDPMVMGSAKTAPTVESHNVPGEFPSEEPNAEVTKEKLQTRVVKVEPLKTEDTESEQEKPEPTADKSPEEAEVIPVAVKKPEAVEKPSQPPEPEKEEAEISKDENPKPADSDGAAVDAVAGQVELKKLDEKAAKEVEEKKAALEKLVAEKKYFVPIGEKKRKRNTSLIVLILALLVLIGGYLAVDAGIIETSVKLPLDLIKN